MAKNGSKFKSKNIFIFINIVILLFFVCFYGYRLIHYYRIENPKVDKNMTLGEIITLKKNIVSREDGLYKIDDGYIFKGKKVNNYLEYSGYLFRIVSIDKNNNIKLITEDALTNLAWGISTEYNKSYVKSWLDGDKENAGIFYNSLNNPEQFLVDTEFCIDILSKEDKTCTDTITSKVGLLSLIEYNDARGSKSYLNTDNYWWLNNPSSDGVWYVSSNGKIDDYSRSGKDYYSYGIRPVINLKGNISLVSGDGTKEKPYIIENEKGSTLKDKNIGKYIKYSDMHWRIIEKNEDYVRVALDGVIKDEEEDYLRSFSNNLNVYATNNGIGYYLNTTFYNKLDNTYMKTGKVYTNRYDSTVDFDYLNIFNSEINAKVGMMQAGDLFMNDYSDYFLVSRTSTYVNTVYTVLEKNRLYADLPTSKAKVRPVIFLDLDSPIKSGNGTQDNPYIIG